MARTGLGHWVPGTSGNPGGRPKPPHGLRTRLAKVSPRAVEGLAELLDSSDERVRLEAQPRRSSTDISASQRSRRT
jgi:hypothetical protein